MTPWPNTALEPTPVTPVPPSLRSGAVSSLRCGFPVGGSRRRQTVASELRAETDGSALDRQASPSTMKYVAFAFMLAVAGCAHTQPTSEARSPYERYLPQAPPAETNRIEFAAGYSLVSPVGWTVRTIPIEDWLKTEVADQIEIAGLVADEYPPRIQIQHLGPDEYALYHGMLHAQNLPDGWKQDGWKYGQFQGQAALSKFEPGYGSRLATGPWFDSHYMPCLTHELFFERDGNGFILTFDMRNADKGKPYYTEPVPVIEQYFETFRFKKPVK